jgi:hypothetical protein
VTDFAQINPQDRGPLMGTAVDYGARATECRRLAGQYTRPEDWGHFLEMAETWEIRHQQETSRSQTIALADRFREVLFLSDNLSKQSTKVDNDEKVA